MVARVAKQAVVPDSQLDWRQAFAWLPKIFMLTSIAALVVMGWMKMNDPQFLPIQKVRAQGAFINLTEAMLLTRAGDIKGGYFNIDVRGVQKNIESLAWVDKAYVKRTWPDTLVISVTEQNAVAAWQDNSLINVRGELFYPEKETFPAHLPQLNGPADSHQQLLKLYRTTRSILSGTGLNIQQLEMDARRAMTIRLDNGLTILLGRDAYIERIERFVRVYAKVLMSEINSIQKIDMRYTNGFSITRQQ